MIFPGPLPLVREGTIFNTILIYGDLTKAETLTVNSTLSIDCIPLSNPQTFLVVPPVEYDLSNLKLVPSFKLVKQP